MQPLIYAWPWHPLPSKNVFPSQIAFTQSRLLIPVHICLVIQSQELPKEELEKSEKGFPSLPLLCSIFSRQKKLHSTSRIRQVPRDNQGLGMQDQIQCGQYMDISEHFHPILRMRHAFLTKEHVQTPRTCRNYSYPSFICPTYLLCFFLCSFNGNLHSNHSTQSSSLLGLSRL